MDAAAVLEDLASPTFAAPKSIVHRLRHEEYESQPIPNFQRVTISGEETSGVSSYSCSCPFLIFVKLAYLLTLLYFLARPVSVQAGPRSASGSTLCVRPEL